MLNKSHYLTIGVFSLLFLLLYFGFDTKPKDIKLAEKSRANLIESTNIQNLLQEARGELRADEMGVLDAMFMRLEMAETDSAKIQEFKNLSSTWYQKAFYGIAGHYAEEIAEIQDDELSWSIAGTTYATGIKNAKETKEKEFCSLKSRQAFEKAISINPSNLNHKINLAVTYAEMPVAENPMKGVLMLIEMNKENPKNTSVMYQLARFGFQTGQNEKAVQRLDNILALEPGNQRAICLLSEIYSAMGNKTKADNYSQQCNNKNI